MLHARMNINRQVDWSSPSEERSTTDQDSWYPLHCPRPILNTTPSQYAAWDSHRSHISSTSTPSYLSLKWSPIHSHWSQRSRIETSVEQQLHTLGPSTNLLQTWWEMERSKWAMYRLLRCTPTTSQSHCQCLPAGSTVLRWEWSGLELGMALEMASVCFEMFVGMVSELPMASGMLMGSKLIGHVSF